MHTKLLSFACIFFITLFDHAGASCYYPDGSFPTDYVYVPCSGSEFTSCCIMSEGDQCLSNGLCYYPNLQSIFRGACTDKNWNSPNCFNHCTNKTNSYADSYDRIVKCGGDRHCCTSDGSACCNDDSKVFTLGNISVIKDLATTTRKTGGFQAAATSIGTTPTGSYSVSRSLTMSAEARSEGIATTPTNSATKPTSTFSSSNTASDAGSSVHSFSKTAIIAASVGATLFFVALIALLWFFIRRHYQRRLNPNNKEQAIPMSSDGFNRLQDKSPRPIEVPAPLHSPLPLYQPPSYQSPPTVHGAVEIDDSHLPPSRNQLGQPVFEVPAQPFRHV